MLVGIGRVVLLGDVIEEQTVGQRLVAVRVRAGDIQRDRIVVADVLAEGLPALAVEHDDAHHPVNAGEEVVLPALVIMQRADHALAREHEIRLPHRLRQVG